MDVILIPLLKVITIAINLYINLIIISVIYSLLMAFGILSGSNRYVYMAGIFFYRITEPFYKHIRKVLPPIANIDFSPMVLILGLVFVQEAAARLAMKLM